MPDLYMTAVRDGTWADFR